MYGAVVGTGPAVRWHHSRQLLVDQPSTMNGQLLPAREECVAGEPSFACERAGNREEALDALEGLFALVPDELLAAYVRRQPAVLAEILAVGLEPHLLAGVELEPCVRTVVQARRRRRCHGNGAPRRMSALAASEDPLRGRGGGPSWVRIAYRDLLRLRAEPVEGAYIDRR